MDWKPLEGSGAAAETTQAITPGEVQAVVERVDREMNRLRASVAAGHIVARLRADWTEFEGEWRGFLSRARSTPASTVLRTAVAFAKETRQWQRAFDSPPDPAGEPEAARARAELEALHANFIRLDSDIMASDLRDAFKRAWRRFADEWRLFQVLRRTETAARWGDTADRLRAYRARLPSWHTAFARERRHSGVRVPGVSEVGGLGGPRVDARVQVIKTAEQARAMLDAAETQLRAAVERTKKVPFIGVAAGLRQALIDSIGTVQRYIVRVRPQLPATGPLADETLRRKVALATVQAEDRLKQVDDAISDPELRFLPNLVEAFGQVAQGVGKAARSTVSWLPIVVGAAGVVLVAGALTRR
jgi:hypothetical protein